MRRRIMIEDKIINLDHIIYVDLNANIAGQLGVEITLSAISGQIGHGYEGTGELRQKTLAYVGKQAEVLRPFLMKVLPCPHDGWYIDLPEEGKSNDRH